MAAASSSGSAEPPAEDHIGNFLIAYGQSKFSTLAKMVVDEFEKRPLKDSGGNPVKYQLSFRGKESKSLGNKLRHYAVKILSKVSRNCSRASACGILLECESWLTFRMMFPLLQKSFRAFLAFWESLS